MVPQYDAALKMMMHAHKGMSTGCATVAASVRHRSRCSGSAESVSAAAIARLQHTMKYFFLPAVLQ
jgi:hypothetical protein